jgi:uncharacterized iron-regulated membrane protein
VVGGTTTGASAAEQRGRISLRPVLWRLHFLTGFLAGPVLVWLCLTGILFAWNPQIESALYRDALTASSEAGWRPLSAQVTAVTAEYPDDDVVEVKPAERPGATTAVVLRPRGAKGDGVGPAPGMFTVYVDPGAGRITGRIDESRRPDEWLRNLHSNFRLGTGAGTLTELAASLILVSLVTGLVLWWPQTRRGLRRAFLPRPRGLRGGGRRVWRDFHAAVGVLTVAAVGVLVVTGLTWTEYAGRWVDVARETVLQEGRTLRTDLVAHAGHGGMSGAAGEPIRLGDVDRVAAAAAELGVPPPRVIAPPERPDQAWTVTHVDSRWPVREFSVAIDPHSGNVTDRVAFSEQPLLDRATTLGIRFHQAELFGLANQIGLTLLTLAVLVLMVSGYVMWWRRRPEGGLGVPPKVGPLLRTVPPAQLVAFGALLVLLPTLGVAFVVYLLAERLVRAGGRRTAAFDPT